MDGVSETTISDSFCLIGLSTLFSFVSALKGFNEVYWSLLCWPGSLLSRLNLIEFAFPTPVLFL